MDVIIMDTKGQETEQSRTRHAGLSSPGAACFAMCTDVSCYCCLEQVSDTYVHVISSI